MSRAAPATNNLVVVDGSNIATEGRPTPSLAQLNEAVRSFREEFPNVNVTVVVDATFGHRIAKNEVTEFNKAVANNELVAPPAGAVGRGDAFVLGIANKSGARILSNDSFQEFHGTYPWLFEEGRLIGGKPVPHVGWVFVTRLPVKGPVSRKARAAAASVTEPSRSGSGGAQRSRSASKAASQPMPVPTSPPPGVVTSPKEKPASTKADTAKVLATAAAATPRGAPVNELIPFIDFVQHHPVGSSVTGIVESYSSHGAYVTIGDVRGYVPLRLMGHPPPRSAREVMKHGEAVTLVVDSFSPARRNVDLGLPGVAVDVPSTAAAPEPPPAPAKRSRAKKAAEPKQAEAAPAEPPVEPPRQAKKAAAKKASAAAKTASKAPAKKAAAKGAAPAKAARSAKADKSAQAVKPAKSAAATKSTRSSRSKKAVASPS